MCLHGILNDVFHVNQNFVPKEFHFQFAKNFKIYVWGDFKLSSQIIFLMFVSYKSVTVSV